MTEKKEAGKREGAVPKERMYPASYLVTATLAGLITGTLVSFLWFKTANTKPLTVTGSVRVPSDTTESEVSPGNAVPTHTNTNTASPVSENPGGILSIEDQLAGFTVSIANAQVGPDQWVVVAEDREGQVGNILGAARFVGGAQSGLVELLRATAPGKTYYGLIYKDDGDRIFSLEGDAPLRDATGNLILVSFTAR